MPILIIESILSPALRAPTKKPPGRRLLRRSCRGGRVLLPLRELLAFARLVKADLLSLDFARIARHQPRLGKYRLERRVELDQGAREAMANRAGLSELAAAVNIDLDIHAVEVVGQRQR